MKNTFSQAHIVGITSFLNSIRKKSLVKASGTFTTAVVIGQPGIVGCAMLSFMEETNEPGRSGWLVTKFPDNHPREVADGEVDLLGKEDATLFYWADMLKEVGGAVA